MRLLLLALILALLGWIGGGSWYWVCKVKGHCNDQMAETQLSVDSLTPDIPVPPFLVSYQGKPLMTLDANLRFPRSGAIARVPIEVKTRLDSLATYLKKHPDQDIEITGLFATEETNSSTFSNLGLARADFVRELLASRGIPDDRMIRSFEVGELTEMPFTAQDTLLGGINLRLVDRQIAATDNNLPDTTDSPETPGSPEKNRAVATPVFEAKNLYFDFKSSQLSMNEEIRNYITQTIQYLNQNSGKKLLLTGHTDGMGLDSDNQNLGLQRAETVRKFFEEFGLASRQITVASKGESQPLGSNETEEGRAKNRRVEVKIQ
ncbi:MAG: OmpA family protein [Bacteroidia bacterium]|nr:OmpA family protein [Bacteroidia bacterium]